jgi:hypothetical protein
MPQEIFNKEEFIELSEKASQCIIKRNIENIKLKLRTPKYLYTIVVDSDEAENLINKLSCPTVEI